MWLYIALAVVAVVVVAVLVVATMGRDRTDETERFHRARELTSRWSAEGPESGLPSSARDGWPGGRLPAADQDDAAEAGRRGPAGDRAR